ncbi:hypothetical protein NPIL_74791, partial [Nephila pilipes]
GGCPGKGGFGMLGHGTASFQISVGGKVSVRGRYQHCEF